MSPKLCRLILTVICIPFAGCAGISHSLGLDGLGSRSDGSYVPYPAELTGDCPQLLTSMRLQIGIISGVDERANKERLTTPTTIMTAAGRAFDIPHLGLRSVRDAKDAHARLGALRKVATSKPCNLDGLPEITGATATLSLFSSSQREKSAGP
jgi:hypothetical protein